MKAFFHITMPMMKNVSFVCTILMFIWTINNFENIYLMTQGGAVGFDYDIIDTHL